MAISATINKISLNIADMDRHYYQTHKLTVAQHPSETDLRFMVRIIVFALNASEDLSFTKGLNADDEPDVWVKSLTDDIELWISLGQLDEKWIRKACARSEKVIVYTYEQRKSLVWWNQNADKLARFNNLSVVQVNAVNPEKLIQRNIELQCNIQDGEMALSTLEGESRVTLSILKPFV